MFRGRWKVDEINQKEKYQLSSWDDATKIIASNESEILDLLESKKICAIQDDYPFWAKNDYKPFAGKPIWIDGSNTHHHIIFDDNIKNQAHDSIVSVRCRQSQKSDAFLSLNGKQIQELHGTCLVRVPTIEPMLNSNWFLEQILICQQSYYNNKIIS